MNNSEQLVTIGIACYNSARFLGEALQSALAQTHRNIEVLLYNDGSSDDSLAVFRSFDDPRLVLIDVGRNSGVATARQVIKTLARGEFLVWHDADDLFHPRRIEILLDAALQSGADLVIDNTRMMDEAGTILPGGRRVPDSVTSDPHFTRIFERNAMLPHPLIRRRCFTRIDYDPLLTTSEDYDYWLRCSQTGFTFQRVDQALIDYRLTAGSLSSDPAKGRAALTHIYAKFELTELQRLYRQRGFAEEVIHYMTCLQNIYRQSYAAALKSASFPWPRENEADRDFYLGTLSLLCDNLAAAEKHLRQHLEQVQQSPAGLNNLGVLLQRQGKDGGPHWHRALDLFPQYLDARANLNGTETLTLTQLPPQRHR